MPQMSPILWFPMFLTLLFFMIYMSSKMNQLFNPTSTDTFNTKNIHKQMNWSW